MGPEGGHDMTVGNVVCSTAMPLYVRSSGGLMPPVDHVTGYKTNRGCLAGQSVGEHLVGQARLIHLPK